MPLTGAKYLFLSSFILTMLVFTGSAGAQSSEDGVIVTVTPAIYGPNENISIMLSSFSDNLDVVPITWFVNGKSALSGTGRKSFSVTSGALGTQSSVLARITLPEGQVQKTITIRPNTTVLLWEALDSHVPPFYKGKALPGPDTRIKVVAMPEIKSGSTILDPKSLIYNWKKDYSNDAESSGYGKNSFTYISDFLENSNIIEMAASTTSGAQSAAASARISHFEPEISFYRKDAEQGTIYENQITDGYLVKNGEVLVAVPYFISPKDIRRPDLIFSWFINDTLANVPILRKNSLQVRIQEGTSGTSKLRLEIENVNKVFQSTEKELELNF